MSTADETLLIGVGHPDRADDRVGLLVVARLAARLAGVARFAVVECRGDVLALIDRWGTADTVVLIDAATTSTPEPGRIHRIDASAGVLPYEVSLSSTHVVGIAETIALAAALDRLPRRVIVYAVEAACFEPGAPMTEEVTAAAGKLPELILAELAGLHRELTRLAPADPSRSKGAPEAACAVSRISARGEFGQVS